MVNRKKREPKRKLTDEIRSYLIENYKKETKEFIARKYDVNIQTVIRWGKELGLLVGHRRKRDQVIVVCRVCNKEFTTAAIYVKARNKTAKHCSHECAKKALQSPLTDLLIKLAEEGFSNREIAEKLEKNEKYVINRLRDLQYRRKVIEGSAEKTLRDKFKAANSACQICGFNRSVDAAHIIPAHKGGSYHESNLVALCPNHHRLFDRFKLTQEEAEKLKDKVINWMDYVEKQES